MDPAKAIFDPIKDQRKDELKVAKKLFEDDEKLAEDMVEQAEDELEDALDAVEDLQDLMADAEEDAADALADIAKQQAKALKDLEKELNSQLGDLDEALDANRKTFTNQIRQAAKDLAKRAETIEPQLEVSGKNAVKLIEDAAKALDKQLKKTPLLRENALLGSLGMTHSFLTGYDVGVAVIDSGITPSDNIEVEEAFDFTGTVTDSKRPDAYGHGTHVAGLVANTGEEALDGTYRGVAPGVRLIDLKVLDQYGQGFTSDVILAIEFAIVMRDELGIDVINLSLGHPIYEPAASDPLVQAVEMAVDAGIVVVVSAGNIGRNLETGEVGYAGITSPGNAPSAITVGSLNTQGTPTRTDDIVAPYSSRGPSWYDGYAKPDLVAPGHKLISAAADNSTLAADDAGALVVGQDADDPNLLSLSGTSMATGVTSGVVALVIEANRYAVLETGRYYRLTPNTIKGILQYTAVRVGDEQGYEADVLTQGAGAINPEGAATLASLIDASAPVGTSWLLGPVDPFTTVNNETYSWS